MSYYMKSEYSNRGYYNYNQHYQYDQYDEYSEDEIRDDSSQEDLCPVTELHYITPLNNVKSIFEHGILSHNRASQISHEDLSNQGVQSRRAEKMIPYRLRSRFNAETVHDCANLYFNAKNAMLESLKPIHNQLCILRISPEVIGFEGAIITNCNAAKNGVQFTKASDGLELLDFESIFSEKMPRNENPTSFRDKKFAELLMPSGYISKNFITGAYVSGYKSMQAFNRIFNNRPPVPCEIGLFSQSPPLSHAQPEQVNSFNSSSSNSLMDKSISKFSIPLLTTQKEVGELKPSLFEAKYSEMTPSSSSSSQETVSSIEDDELLDSDLSAFCSQNAAFIKDLEARKKPVESFLTESSGIYDSEIHTFAKELKSLSLTNKYKNSSAKKSLQASKRSVRGNDFKKKSKLFFSPKKYFFNSVCIRKKA